MRIVAERMRSLEERCHELSSQRVPQRVAGTLLRLLGQVDKGRAASRASARPADEAAGLSAPSGAYLSSIRNTR
jgi:hypothetical protein